MPTRQITQVADCYLVASEFAIQRDTPSEEEDYDTKYRTKTSFQLERAENGGCSILGKEYRALMQRLQGLEDAFEMDEPMEMDEAMETATGFREYAEIWAVFQSEGKL